MAKWNSSFQRKEIMLLDRTKQEYFIDPAPKSFIAEVRNNNTKICVNKKFEKLSINQKLAIIYHELGHLRFKLYNFFREIANIFSYFSILLTFIFAFFLVIDLIFKINLFNISKVICLVMVLLGIIFFSLSMFIYWFLEIIADINSSARINKKYLIKLIEGEYTGKKISFWRRNILHPPWKLRKKIMEKFD